MRSFTAWSSKNMPLAAFIVGRSMLKLSCRRGQGALPNARTSCCGSKLEVRVHRERRSSPSKATGAARVVSEANRSGCAAAWMSAKVPPMQ